MDAYVNFGLMKRYAIKLILIALISFPLKAQYKYWVYDSLLATHVPDRCSSWLNACTYHLEPQTVRSLITGGVLVKPVLIFQPANTSINESVLGFALEQVEGQKFIDKGLTGKGIKIGIIDGGFLDADDDLALKEFFKEKKVLGYRDYITPDLEPYSGARGLNDNHGTEVWKLIGGMPDDNEIQFGLATQSEYYLARTDHGAYEKRIEEDYLVEALEWMFEEGVRLVNVSLGYTNDYMDSTENYSPYQMDGKSTAIARAIDIAYQEKEMLVIVSAGNDGDSEWEVLSTPADAFGAFSVGASKLYIWDKMNYSSIGTPGLPYLKPNVSCFAALGTSYSAPVITGIAACMMEYRPDLTVDNIRKMIEMSANFYPHGNNYLGYGVPRCSILLNLMDGKDSPEPTKIISTKKSHVVIRGKIQGKYIVTYPKINDREVIERLVFRPDKNKIKIKRHKEAAQTSVLINNQVTEIFWSDQ